jgi:hypothetical protein
MTNPATKKKSISNRALVYTENRGLGASPQEAASIAGYAKPGQAEAMLIASPELREYEVRIREKYSNQIGETASVLLQSIVNQLAAKPSEDFLTHMFDRFSALILPAHPSAALNGNQAAGSANIQVNVGDAQAADDMKRRLDSLQQALARRDSEKPPTEFTIDSL